MGALSRKGHIVLQGGNVSGENSTFQNRCALLFMETTLNRRLKHTIPKGGRKRKNFDSLKDSILYNHTPESITDMKVWKEP
jgi:hypothetical protein